MDWTQRTLKSSAIAATWTAIHVCCVVASAQHWYDSAPNGAPSQSHHSGFGRRLLRSVGYGWSDGYHADSPARPANSAPHYGPATRYPLHPVAPSTMETIQPGSAPTAFGTMSQPTPYSQPTPPAPESLPVTAPGSPSPSSAAPWAQGTELSAPGLPSHPGGPGGPASMPTIVAPELSNDSADTATEPPTVLNSPYPQAPTPPSGPYASDLTPPAQIPMAIPYPPAADGSGSRANPPSHLGSPSISEAPAFSGPSATPYDSAPVYSEAPVYTPPPTTRRTPIGTAPSTAPPAPSEPLNDLPAPPGMPSEQFTPQTLTEDWRPDTRMDADKTPPSAPNASNAIEVQLPSDIADAREVETADIPIERHESAAPAAPNIQEPVVEGVAPVGPIGSIGAVGADQSRRPQEWPVDVHSKPKRSAASPVEFPPPPGMFEAAAAPAATDPASASAARTAPFAPPVYHLKSTTSAPTVPALRTPAPPPISPTMPNANLGEGAERLPNIDRADMDQADPAATIQRLPVPQDVGAIPAKPVPDMVRLPSIEDVGETQRLPAVAPDPPQNLQRLPPVD